MPSLGGVTYTEMLTSGSGSGARTGGARRQRIVECDWSDKDDLLKAFLGISQAYGGAYEFTLPEPFEPGSGLYASSYTLQGIKCTGADSSGNITFERARLVITFEPLERDPDDDNADNEPWEEINRRSYIERLQIPAWGLRWESDEEPLDFDQVAAIDVGYEDFTLQRSNVAVVNGSALNAAKGKMNSDTFWGYAAGYLLFAGWSETRRYSADGQTVQYAVTLELKARSVPWNHFWRPGNGWEEVERTDGEPLIASTEFASI